MRVKDATFSVYFGLEALPWHPAYLAAMWILGGELRSLYADWIEPDEIPLVESTMALVREVVTDGESPPATSRAADLADAWRPTIVRRDKAGASGGLLNALATFEALAQEIGGLSGHYDAGNWAVNAAEVRWDDWDRPGPILVDWNEQADESSPKMQTLLLFGRVVSAVGALTGPDWDPAPIRAQILGTR